MYQLHIANKNYSSWSLRAWVLMKALQLPFEEKLSAFDAETNWQRFRGFSPSGLVPCLRDGEQVVWDSLAIAEYLAETYPQVWPADKSQRAWARCAAAEMHSGFITLRSQCPMNCGTRFRLNNIDAALSKNIARIQELWLDGLNRFKGPFLAGKDFTAVDAFFAPVVFRFQTYGFTVDEQVKVYLETMLNDAAMQEWYAAAIKETWREEETEQLLAHTATQLQDYRN